MLELAISADLTGARLSWQLVEALQPQQLSTSAWAPLFGWWPFRGHSTVARYLEALRLGHVG